MHIHTPLFNTTATDRGTNYPVRWDRRAFRNLGIVSVTILITPFILFTVWNLVKGWGRWRIRKSGNRPHYVRTWHGWVEAEKAAMRAAARAKLRNYIRQKLVWKSTTADYSWVFWDPSGAKRQEYEENRRGSILRHLPRWMRSYEPGSLLPDARITPNRLGVAEEGKVSLRSFRHSSEIQPLGFSFTGNQSWLRSSSQKGAGTLTENHSLSDALPMMTGALADSRIAHSLSSVRRRKFPIRRFQVWDATSQETFRATGTQSLVPNQTGNLGADVDPARKGGASALRVQPSPTSHCSQNVAAGLARRASSLPLFATLRNAYNARRRLRSPVETLPVRSHPARVCDHHSAPENPDDLQGSDHSTTRLRNTEGNLQASMPLYERKLMQTFNQSLEPLAKPIVLHPFMSIGTEYSGTAGRPGSPIMGWTIKGEPSAVVGELSQYEAEGPVKGASSFSCSRCSSATFRSRSSGEYSDMHLNEASLQKTKDPTVTSNLDTYGRTGSHSARNVRVSDSFFQGSYSPGVIARHFSLLPRNTSGTNLTSNPTSRVLRRSRKVTSEACFAEHSSYTERLSMSLHVDSFNSPWRIHPYSTTLVPFDDPRSSKQSRSPTKSSTWSTTNAKTIQRGSASGTSRLSEAKKAPTKRTECLSSLEKTLLDDLDLRLGRLDYELSPGFRGPQGDGTTRWWFEAVPYAASVATRGPHCFVKHTSTRSRPLNPPPALRRSHTALEISKTIDITVPTTVMRRRASSQGLMLVRSTSTYTGEPEEGAIDTAAWMLRRPPMGALREDSAEKTLLFTNGRGPAKTLLEWQQSEPLLPLQQALDSAAAVSRRPVKHLKRLGILSNDQNDGCKDGKQPLRAASDHCENLGDRLEESPPTTAPVIGMTPIQRIFNRVSVAIDKRIDRASPMGYRSPNRTMMH